MRPGEEFKRLSEDLGQADPVAAGSSRRLADLIEPDEAVAVRYPLTSSSWGKVAVLAGVLTLLYGTELRGLIRLWLADENWSHGFIIPLFSLFLIYNWRRSLLQTPRQACFWGWGVILLAILIRSLAAVLLHNAWIVQLTIPLMLFGVVLTLTGPAMARLLSVPIFFLALAAPLPDSIYQSISLRLQNLAAALSTALMRLFGAKIEVTASFMEVTSITGQVHPLEVAEACSGVRSLMAFVALGVAMAYVQERPFWQRLVIMLMGIPIALVVNILRVAATSTMYVFDQPELGQDFMHTAMGMVLLIPALLLLFLLTQLLDGLYVDVEEEDSPSVPADASSEMPEGKP